MGIWDVDGMLAEMPWEQYKGWYMYYQLDPFGNERGDLQAGIIASTIANVNRDSDKKPELFSPSDFMATFGSKDSIEHDTRGSSRSPMTQEQWEATKLNLIASLPAPSTPTAEDN